MQQLLTVWNALDPRKRAIAALATLAVVAAILFLSQVVSKPHYALLYSGLDNGATSEVIAALEQQNISFEVRGSAIFVDSSQRDRLRISLAGEGLPAGGAMGYELLDNLSGFGTTAQMFDAAYWRAKEGELARSILVMSQVDSARVHISNQNNQPFSRVKDVTASVTLGLRNGELSAQQVKAIQHLIASAVAGLNPQQVAVIDAERGIVYGTESDQSKQKNGGALGLVLKHKVERLLAARVGTGKSVVEVSVSTKTDRETLVERRVDPQSRVAISTDTEETSGNATDSGGSGVTVASNLPEGDASNGGSSNESNTETRERVNYEISETTREIVRPAGDIERLSVAVIVDGLRDDTGWSPRSEGELGVLRELVESAVGFDESRGDIVTVKSLEFSLAESGGDLVVRSPFDFLRANGMKLIELSTISAVILVLSLFVIRPILSAKNLQVLEGPVDAMQIAPGDAMTQIDSATAGGGANDPIAQLRRIISERSEESADVLRAWIETEEEKV